MKFLLTAILVFFLFAQSFGQSWKELNDSLELYLNNGDYNNATLLSEKAITAAKKEFGENHSNYANSLNNQAQLYTALGQYKQAEPLYIQSNNILKKALGENDSLYASSVDNMAHFYEITGKYEKAEKLFFESIAIRKKILGPTHQDYAESLSNLASLYESMGQYERAEQLYVESLEIRKKVLGTTHPYYVQNLTDLAALYTSMNQYEKAKLLFIESIEIGKKVLGPTHQDYAASLNNLATLYAEIGQHKKAEPLLIESMGILKQVLGPMHPDYASSLSNLAALYTTMRQYEKVEPLYVESLEIYKKALGIEHPDYAASLNYIATFYTSIGQYEKAEPLLVESIQIGKKTLGSDHPDYAQSLNDLANLYIIMGQLKKAEPLLIESMKIREKALGSTHKDYAHSLNNLANLYRIAGEYDKAESLYIASIGIRKKIFGIDHPAYATSLANLAFIYKNMGRFEKAKLLFIESMGIRKKVLGANNPDYASSLTNLAFLYLSEGQFEKAEPLILEANRIEIQNLSNIFSTLSEKEKGNYLANKIISLQANNSFVFNNKRTSTAILQNNFNQQLFLKSLALDRTKAVLDAVRYSSDTVVQQIFGKWESRKKLLAKQYALPVAKRRSDVKKIEEEAENLEKDLSRKSTDFRKQRNAVRVSMKEVQNNLQQNEVAIEFVSFKLYNKKWTDSTIYAAYLVNNKDSIPNFVPLFEEGRLQQLIDSSGKTTTTIAKLFYRGAGINDKNTKQGEALYKLVWQPLEPYLKGVKKISYSPSGKLFGIAFHALPINNDSLLMEKYQLRQYTSTRQVALRNTENQSVKPTDMVLFGDPNFSMDSIQLTKLRTSLTESYVSRSIYTPTTRDATNNSWPSLPGTAEEVNSIKQLFNKNKIATRSFAQTAASEENLKALSGNSPQILHIATHGFFLPEPNKAKNDKALNQTNAYTLADDPLLRTGLILAGGNYAWSGKTPVEGVEDGIATAYEISQLNLSNTELVVLSACETALGDVKGSEGVFGLQRAFKMAGVKKMLVSLWKIPDKETAELMTSFYTYWMNGKTINDAFTEAQAEMRKKYPPFYWAAFVLVE